MGGLCALGASLTCWSKEDLASFGAISADGALAVANRVMLKQIQHQWVSHLIQLQTEHRILFLGQQCDKLGYFEVWVRFLRLLCSSAQVLLILSRAPHYK